MLAPGFMNSVYCTETEMSGHAKLHANCYLYIYILKVSTFRSFFLMFCWWKRLLKMCGCKWGIPNIKCPTPNKFPPQTCTWPSCKCPKMKYIPMELIKIYKVYGNHIILQIYNFHIHLTLYCMCTIAQRFVVWYVFHPWDLVCSWHFEC